MTTIIIAIVTLIVGAVVGYFLSKKSVDKQNQDLIDEATRKAQVLINDAEKDGETIKKEKIFQAKEKFLELKSKHEEVVNQRERKVADAELKVKEREDRNKLDFSEIQKQKDQIKSEKGNIQSRTEKLNIKQKEVDTMHKKQVEILEKTSKYSA
ncbi:MAG: Rnase Y domain-containing protein, partial [Algoriella sp.]